MKSSSWTINILMGLVTSLLVSDPAYADDVPFVSEEFSFRAHVPANKEICSAASGGHIHGLFYNINPSYGCKPADKISKVRTIALYASYNSAFFASAAQALPQNCKMMSAGSIFAKIIPLKISGRPTAYCVKHQADKSIDVFVELQAGRWPDSQSAEMAYINYTVSLHTYPDKLSFDLKIFSDFLSKIEVDI